MDYFSLPLELRLHIYSYLIKPSLHLDFCTSSVEKRLLNTKAPVRPSPLLSYLHKRRETTQWSRSHGFHLLATSRRVRSEMLSLIDRLEPILTIHCSDCLNRVLSHLTRDLGLRFPIVKAIQQRVLAESSVGLRLTFSSPDTLCEAVEGMKAVLVRNYGTYEALWIRKPTGWEDGKARPWFVVHDMVIGRVRPNVQMGEGPLSHGDGVGDEMDVGGDEQDEADLDDEDVLDADELRGASTDYYVADGLVKEIETITKRIDVPDIWDLKSKEWKAAKRVASMWRIAPEDGKMWRESETLNREWKRKRRSTKGLMLRDEVWVGVQMRA